jgi:hypothetical protein
MELTDRQNVSLIKQHQVDLQKHQAYLGNQLRDLHEQLGHPPHIQVAQALGAGLAGLLGGGSAMTSALGGAQLNANRDWQIAQSQGQQQQQFLQQQYNTDQRQIEGWNDTEYNERVRQQKEQLDEQRIQDAEDHQKAQEAVAEARADIQGEREDRALKQSQDRNALDWDTHTKTDWNNLAGKYKDTGGIITPDQKRQAYLDVDMINDERRQHGLRPLPYLPEGQTETAKYHDSLAKAGEERIAQAATKLDEEVKNWTNQHNDRVLAIKTRAASATEGHQISAARQRSAAGAAKLIQTAASNMEAAKNVYDLRVSDLQRQLDALLPGDLTGQAAIKAKIDSARAAYDKATEKAKAQAIRP